MAVWQGLDQLNEMAAAIKAMPQALGEEAVMSVKEKTPSVTGRLRNSMKSEVTNGTIMIGSELDYSKPVEYGTEDTPPVGMLGATALELPDMIDKLLGTDR